MKTPIQEGRSNGGKKRIETYNGIDVLRDDLLVGGTKSLLMNQLSTSIDEYVYVSPVYGALQIALSDWCNKNYIKCTIISAKRKVRHPNTIKAEELGAKIIEVPYGYMVVLNKVKKDYLQANPLAKEIPFGLDTEESRDIIAERAKVLDKYDEVWCAIGSGVLVEGILRGTTTTKVNGVVVGKDYQNNHQRLKLWKYHKPFQQLAKKPPFPSTRNYDAKAWEYCMEHHTLNNFFWNVC